MFSSPLALLIWGTLILPTTAWTNKLSPRVELSWKPAQETGFPNSAEHEQLVLDGSSPIPTEAPPRYGRREAVNLNQRALTSQVCAYVLGGLQSLTCALASATCASSDGYLGCCDIDKKCNSIKTTCIDYEAVQAGSCRVTHNLHSLCCKESAPACFTYVLSKGPAPEDSYAFFKCSTSGGLGVLLEDDPNAVTTKDDSFTLIATSTGAAASATSTSEESQDDDSSSGTNVGAIAGGAAGGVATVALIALLAFLLLRRKKKKTNARSAPDATTVVETGNNQQPPTMPQVTKSPHYGFAPSSPSALTQVSGVQSSYGYQQPYSPSLAIAYGQQQAYTLGYEGNSHHPQQQSPREHYAHELPAANSSEDNHSRAELS